MAKEKLLLINAGHGGLRAGKYMTKGKRAEIMGGPYQGSMFYEGIANRMVANMIQFRAMRDGVRSHIVQDNKSDTYRSKRIEEINELCQDYDCILLDIHFNAGGGDGYEGFIASSASAKSKRLAVEIGKRMMYDMGMRVREDYPGLWYKVKDWDLVALTHCPAVLVEGAFFDYWPNQEKILSFNWLTKLSKNYYYAMKKILFENES